jgi:Family of unknown function (DUF695)
MRFPPLTTLKFGDTWTVADGYLDCKPLLLRFRTGVDAIAGHPDLGARLRIVWEYEQANDSGMPSSAELTQINECEDLLSEALEKDNHAILAYTLTCDGLRQWIFYTSDVGESAHCINHALPHDPPCPIEISADPDEDWSEYHQVMANFHE